MLALGMYGPLAASTRYRLSQYVPGLASLGIDVDVRPMLDDDYIRHRFETGSVSLAQVIRGLASRAGQLARQNKYDLAWLQCEMVPFLPGRLEAGMLRIPYVYDVDDAFHVKYSTGRFAKFAPLLGHKFDHVYARATAVLAGNRTLCAHARRFNADCTIVPTVVDHRKYLPRHRSREPGVFNIGWVGSPSSIQCLKIIERPLMELARETRVRLSVVGGIAPPVEGVEVVNIRWSEDTEIEHIRMFDVGIMPLHDDPWTRGKCAFKLIQYMASGVPVIASPVGANVDVVTPDCGILAHSAAGWLDAFRTIRDNPDLGDVLGAAGRKKVDEKYSLEGQVPVVADILRRAAIGRGRP